MRGIPFAVRKQASVDAFLLHGVRRQTVDNVRYEMVIVIPLDMKGIRSDVSFLLVFMGNRKARQSRSSALAHYRTLLHIYDMGRLQISWLKPIVQMSLLISINYLNIFNIIVFGRIHFTNTRR